jgi:HlyD family secretion protein
MKKRTLIIICSVLLLMVLVFIVIKTHSKKEGKVTFETVKVEKGKISNNVTATGTIQAVKSVSVGTQVSGIIQKIYVDFNDKVKKGQLMARLDETPNRSQFDQAQANLDQAQAQYNYQKATFERLKALYEKNLIAKADYDQAQYNFENSKAAITNAKSALTRAQVNLDYCTITSPIDGVVLNRAVEEGQTVAASFNTPTLFTIVNDLTQMQVQTSVDEADIGKIRLGQRVEFNVDAYLDLKFEGTVSQIRLQPVTTNNVVTYVVILNAPNPDKKLMPGMTASATIFVDEKDSTLFLSGKAFRFTPSAEYLQKMRAEFQKRKAENSKLASGEQQGQKYSDQQPQGSAVQEGQPSAGMTSSGSTQGSNSFALPANVKRVWIKTENGGMRPQIVKTGIDNGTNIEILSGLEEGEEVVISMSDSSSKAASSTTASSSNRARGPFPF